MDGKDMLDTLYNASIFNLRKVKIYNWGQICDILQVSPDTDSLISNGYHNNLKMSQSCDSLPI